jgi:hypothetical protein
LVNKKWPRVIGIIYGKQRAFFGKAQSGIDSVAVADTFGPVWDFFAVQVSKLGCKIHKYL